MMVQWLEQLDQSINLTQPTSAAGSSSMLSRSYEVELDIKARINFQKVVPATMWLC